MKKPVKMLTGCGLCLLLNAAAAGIALAAGWTSESGTWKYVNSNGSYAANEWKTSKEESYYLGDEDEVPEEGDISPAYSSAGEDVKWFYFQTNGKAKKAGDGDYATMTVDGRKYYFEENGVMLTGWQALDGAESGDATGISKFVYLGGDDEGFMAKSQWMQLSEHPGDSDDKDEITGSDSDDAPQEGESYWYYFESDGTPAYLKTPASSMSAAATKVSGESLPSFSCNYEYEL
ncbi:hypothetical protein ADH76_23005 [Enterocloster clostridioformis]|uniref:hypothetical protein n=1 Tax=Enterocloster clostridioformis TaxID=1531 RepID=UPI00080C6B83|nr:hypothetical protein [Enterocloster clostridioformis]ANU46433.1 hypothetical protein A4V08_12150 [Lachnoclostridium sp. YL32]NDO31293.1 hypothetical protein [Enterocloster clostridioformis]OXE65148.1 hypothetical protein ADH76_23005 [Enterocloster clostridioformis]QQQ98849.1 hypothetical protein I5Q83_22430 [Enterocloster clostridioformis]